MAFPTGSGSERLKRVSHQFNGNSQTSPTNDYNILNGVALHIYIIISISCFNTFPGARDCIVNIKQDGSTLRKIFKQSVGQDQTFIWNERLVLEGTDELYVFSNGNASEWWISYIDQDWT